MTRLEAELAAERGRADRLQLFEAEVGHLEAALAAEKAKASDNTASLEAQVHLHVGGRHAMSAAALHAKKSMHAIACAKGQARMHALWPMHSHVAGQGMHPHPPLAP